MATLVVPVVLAAGAALTAVETHDRCELPVGPQLLQRQELDAGRGQCVGLSTGGHRFFADLSRVDGELAVALQDVDERIHAKNVEFRNNNSGSVTVVYLSTLTPLDDGDVQAELEQLRGLAVAQEESGEGRPVRILLANAGNDMRHAVFAAEAIKQEAARDPSIVAVVGMGISKKETRDAMVRLSNDVEPRIPMIGISLSATDLAVNSTEYYHQVGPTNVREAVVAASYAAARLNVGTVTIYYSGDPDDLYSTDLQAQMEIAMKARQIPVQSVSYRVGDVGDVSIELAGRQACDVPKETGVVFYAGWAAVLPQFLDSMKSSCDGSYPRIIAGDSVTRFILEDGLQNFPTLAIDYLSFASSLAWGPDCQAGYGRVGIFQQYDIMFGEGTACARTRDGSAIIAYDTVRVVRRAIQNVEADRPTPAEVLRGIDDISTQASGPLSGASGTIDYPGSGARSVPANKAIMILRATGGAVGSPPTRQLLCGVHNTAVPEPDPGVCPTE